MNQITDKLIRDLAEKLGTTTEHLWEVLCRQALISGITNVITIIVWLIILGVIFKIIKKTSAKYEWSDEPKFVAWTCWAVAALIIVLIVGCSAENIVASLFNPEYWALKQITN